MSRGPWKTVFDKRRDEAQAAHRKANPKKKGRKTKMTAAIQDKILELLSLGAHRETACLMAGIGYTTLVNYIERDAAPNKDFLQRMQTAEAQASDAELQKIRAAGDQDWKAAAWYLEKGPMRRVFSRKDPEVVALEKELLRLEAEKKQAEIEFIRKKTLEGDGGSKSFTIVMPSYEQPQQIEAQQPLSLPSNESEDDEG